MRRTAKPCPIGAFGEDIERAKIRASKTPAPHLTNGEQLRGDSAVSAATAWRGPAYSFGSGFGGIDIHLRLAQSPPSNAMARMKLDQEARRVS